ncbi:MAG TPA: 7,8-didemethyl-8-hydroxy-5-deazariboflavin synthase CofG [Candidatus Acidoferrum sp.]|nr:7,8-didemethyl-8-hydroxy-5-deazariboflavin synthase CofG [Candidatus Acidoferrum sp.]HVS74015.1 7,8-didemethyl-8-hydroxy-5-deazariboflavin synthase CofG [Candidatus Acidoferrales bacterium]
MMKTADDIGTRQAETRRGVEAALDRAHAGRGLGRDAAILLYQHAATVELLRAATDVRALGKGSTVSFSKKVFIPLTTLCRDYCSYCTFRKDPGQPGAHFMTPDEVLALAETAREAGCKEALFSLGDQPERVFPEARDFLRRQGFTRTLDYVAAMSEMVLEKTGLLPHANPGVMDRAALERLRESNASVGLMLENISPRLMRSSGPHANAPDKVPALRLRTMEEAGRLSMAFTTGILIGIGETQEERVDSLLAIRAMHERHGHIQEVIVQNFRAKPDIPMAAHPEPALEEMLRTVAIARLVLGGEMNLQAPPNLSYEEFPRLLEAGINDWGGISPVTRDFINPEAAWPQIDRLRRETEARGFTLRERLAIYPEYLRREEFLAPAVRERGLRLADAGGYAREAAGPGPLAASLARGAT